MNNHLNLLRLREDIVGFLIAPIRLYESIHILPRLAQEKKSTVGKGSDDEFETGQSQDLPATHTRDLDLPRDPGLPRDCLIYACARRYLRRQSCGLGRGQDRQEKVQDCPV